MTISHAPDTLPPTNPAARCSNAAVKSATAGAPTWGWVPIRSLSPRHRERIAAHLLSLEVSDRYLRFGYLATDAQISKYVDMLDFEQDEVFGIFSRRLELIAMAHLAHSVVAPKNNTPAVSEFGVSVLPSVRNRGFGRRLFEHAMLHARNRGVGTLLVYALSENTAMLKIAQRAGAIVVREGSESDARLQLPPDTFGSHIDELLEQRAAEIDYRLKVRARQVGGFLSAIGEVKVLLGKTARVVED